MWSLGWVVVLEMWSLGRMLSLGVWSTGRGVEVDTPLVLRHPVAATAAVGTHPTGLHSCLFEYI